MCVYCMVADWGNKWYPEEPRKFDPLSPHQWPPRPASPWTRDQLDEFTDILRRIKKLEDDAGGCPCEEPSKLDFLDAIRKRLDALESGKA